MPAHKLQGERKFHGLDIAIENLKGSERKWYDPHGKEAGSTHMHCDYGYIRGSEGTDGDHVDVYVGPVEEMGPVFIVNQMKKPDFKEFDEQKCMVGFKDADAAKAAYLRQYNDPKFFGSMKAMPFEEFKMKVLDKKNHGVKIAMNPGPYGSLTHSVVGAGIGALTNDNKGSGALGGAIGSNLGNAAALMALPRGEHALKDVPTFLGTLAVLTGAPVLGALAGGRLASKAQDALSPKTAGLGPKLAFTLPEALMVGGGTVGAGVGAASNKDNRVAGALGGAAGGVLGGAAGHALMHVADNHLPYGPVAAGAALTAGLGTPLLGAYLGGKATSALAQRGEKRAALSPAVLSALQHGGIGAGLGAVAGGLGGAAHAGPDHRSQGALRGALVGAGLGAAGGTGIAAIKGHGAQQLATLQGAAQQAEQSAVKAHRNVSGMAATGLAPSPTLAKPAGNTTKQVAVRPLTLAQPNVVPTGPAPHLAPSAVPARSPVDATKQFNVRPLTLGAPDPRVVGPVANPGLNVAQHQASAAGAKAEALNQAARTLGQQQGAMNQTINRAGLVGAAAGTGLMGYMAVPGQYGGPPQHKVAEDNGLSDAQVGVGGGLALGGAAALSKSKPLVSGRTSIYHGTTEALAEKVRQNGLLPSAAVAKGPAITDILPDDIRAQAKNLAYLTHDNAEARRYAGQAQALADLGPNINYHSAETRAARVRGLTAGQNNPRTKGVVHAEVPLWRQDIASKLKANPEARGSFEGFKKYRDPMGMARFMPGAESQLFHEYNGYAKSVSVEGGIAPEFIRGAKYKGVGLRELGEYASAHPKQFAKGVGLAGLGAGAMAGGAYLMGSGVRNKLKEKTSSDERVSRTADRLDDLGIGLLAAPSLAAVGRRGFGAMMGAGKSLMQHAPTNGVAQAVGGGMRNLGGRGAVLAGRASDAMHHFGPHHGLELAGLALVAPGVTHALAKRLTPATAAEKVGQLLAGEKVGMIRVTQTPQAELDANFRTNALRGSALMGLTGAGLGAAHMLTESKNPRGALIGAAVGGIAGTGVGGLISLLNKGKMSAPPRGFREHWDAQKSANLASTLWANKKPLAGALALGTVGAGLYGAKKVVDQGKDMVNSHHHAASYVGVPPGMAQPAF